MYKIKISSTLFDIKGMSTQEALTKIEEVFTKHGLKFNFLGSFFEPESEREKACDIYLFEISDILQLGKEGVSYDIVEFDNEKQWDYVSSNHIKWNAVPLNVPIYRMNLNTQLTVHMSAGLPQVLLQQLVRNRDYSDKTKFDFSYEICEIGSPASQDAPEWLLNWGRIIQKLINDNIDLFKDKEYYDTEIDRYTVEQIAQGKRFDEI